MDLSKYEERSDVSVVSCSADAFKMVRVEWQASMAIVLTNCAASSAAAGVSVSGERNLVTKKGKLL